MTGQNDEEVRRAIRDAMDRLIAGKPLHSDGKLTVKSLAEESRVKRWLLTHRHTDLQDEFRARIANTNTEPPILLMLRRETADAQARVRALTADVSALTVTIHGLERIIQVLALENRELRWSRAQSDKIVPLRPAERHNPTVK
ncbi:hypothetical protein [Mycolicibacter senuensis]|uniref:Uncharacterized protein n=1 Tax=Mycolicibacter senuensis TaxID=386913 RepID=A0A7I9XPV4_9MYCO|nr:hypothetical protein [Mycolicibacter senuensis]ORW69957.1 hypothetical protein AWC24_04300 [Mycolicibacter senuensis]GFG71476.1 hypothetical protein MSEN_31960 [Mycolicibacter senuensis]